MLLIRAVVCDIDGTITNDKKQLQPLAVTSLRRLQNRGIPVMIASGNVLPVALGLSSFIGTKGPIIAENGGLVCYQEQIYKLQSLELPLKAWSYLKERMPEAERLFTDNWRQTEVALKRSLDLERVRAILKDCPVEIEATGFAIHLMEPGHSKLKGIRKACDLIGVDVKEVAAFGDADNDVEMLSGVGFGIAVGNASPRAKAAACYVTERRHARGVQEGLRYLGLL
jgi:phosphoglycolate phosphatase (TIGR01487 family)